jgi:predicted ester cyclase
MVTKRFIGALLFSLLVSTLGLAQDDAEPCTLATLKGRYLFADSGTLLPPAFGVTEPTPGADAGFHIFNGDGTGTDIVTVRIGSELMLENEIVPTSYTVNADCTGTLTVPDGPIFNLFIAPGGDTVARIAKAPLGNFASSIAQRVSAKVQADSNETENNDETSMETANKAVVQRFYDEVFTQKKMAVLDEINDPNFVAHDLDVGGELPGGGLPEVLAAFPDIKATINQWVIEGDLVTAYVTFNGTHQAEYLGVAATGKAITFSIIDIWRVKDGKIVELWHNIPNEDILEQIQSAP